jgi:iron complex outermembrane receptor protein
VLILFLSWTEIIMTLFSTRLKSDSALRQSTVTMAFGIGLLFVLSCGHALAQDQDQGSENNDSDITEVIVTASGFRISPEAMTSNVDIISISELARAPVAGLGDQLAYLTGVRSTGFAPGASRPVIRGLEGNRVMILNNGLGMVDVSALSPDHAVTAEGFEANRIEIIRGPSALMYGGNAIGGVVNIIDNRIVSSAPAPGLTGRALGWVSSVDEGRFLGLSSTLGIGTMALTIDGVIRRSEDYETPVGPESRILTELEGEDPDDGETQVNSAVSLDSFGLGLSKIFERGFIGVSAKTTNSLYGVPGHEHDHGGGGAPEYVQIDLEQDRYDLKGELRLSEGFLSAIRFDGGATDYKHNELEGDEIGTRFTSKGNEWRLNLVREERGPLSLNLGLVSLNRDFEAIGDEAFVPSTDMDEKAAYAQTRFDKGYWGFEAGLRADKRDYETLSHSLSFETQSVSFGGFLRPSDHQFFGFSLTRSERMPTEAELFADGPHLATAQYVIGSDEFKTEIGTSLEFTGHWEIDSHMPLMIDLHIFASRFDRYIDQLATGAVIDDLPVYRYVQTDATIEGLELEARAPLGDIAGWKSEILAGYDTVRGKSDLGPLGRIPPQALSLGLTAKNEGLEWRIENRFVASRSTRLAENEIRTKAYTLINLSLGYKPNSQSTWKLMADVRNLTNAEVREATSYTKDIVVGAARSFRLGIQVSF